MIQRNGCLTHIPSVYHFNCLCAGNCLSRIGYDRTTTVDPSQIPSNNSCLDQHDCTSHPVHPRVRLSHVPNHPATPNPLTLPHRVLLSAPRRSSAIPSPDGKLAVYTVSTYSFESHSKQSEIRVLDIASGHSTVVTSDQKASEPNWLGEGNELIWLLESEKGITKVIVGDADDTGRKYTAGSAPGPISNVKLKVLAKGKVAIVVSGQAKPDGFLFNPEDVPKSYSSGKVYNSLMVRHWDKYVSPNRNALWYGVLERSAPHITESRGRWTLSGLTNALRGTKLEAPIPPFGGTDHFDVGQHGILFVSKDPSSDPAYTTKCDCYFIPLSTFKEQSPKMRKFNTPGFEGAASSPALSPIEGNAAFLKMKKDGYESDKNSLVVIHDLFKSDSTVEALTSDDGHGVWDRSPSSVSWSNNGLTLYLQAEDTGRGLLFEFTPTAEKGYPPKKITHDGHVSDVRPAAMGSSKLFISSSTLIDNSLYSIIDPTEPHEIRTVSSSSRDGLSFGLSKDQVSEIWFKGAGDYKVHAWVMKPSNFNESSKYPLAYLVHGGPQGAWTDQWSTRWNPAIFAEQGYVVVAPNPTGSTSYGQDFVDGIRTEWGGRPYEDLANGFAYIKEHMPFVDTKRAVGLGASYGGFMMNWIQGQPLAKEFKALVTHDGVFSMMNQMSSDEQFFPTHDLGGPYWEAKENWERYDPARYTGNWSTPMLVIHNELDYRLPISEGLAAFNVLQKRGVESQFLTFPDENHWVLKHENSLVWHTVVLNWINKFVGLPPYKEEGKLPYEVQSLPKDT